MENQIIELEERGQLIISVSYFYVDRKFNKFTYQSYQKENLNKTNISKLIDNKQKFNFIFSFNLKFLF